MVGFRIYRSFISGLLSRATDPLPLVTAMPDAFQGSDLPTTGFQVAQAIAEGPICANELTLWKSDSNRLFVASLAE